MVDLATWEDPIAKREQFGVSLRKKKKEEIIKNKRMMIRSSMGKGTEQEKDKEAPGLTPEEQQILLQMKQAAMDSEAPFSTQVDQLISYLYNLLLTSEFPGSITNQIRGFVTSGKATEIEGWTEASVQLIAPDYLTRARTFMKLFRIETVVQNVAHQELIE